MAVVTLALLVAGAALFAALYALAPPSPDQEVGAIAQYGEAGGGGAGAGSGQVAVSGDGGGSLPFTGLFAIPLVILAAALLASGGFLRRWTRRSETE
jgi:hypothetical protein